MFALCVRQPFAGLIAYGYKTIEVRSWEPAAKHIGTRIMIVASGNLADRASRDFVHRETGWKDGSYQRGGMICTVELAAVKWQERAQWLKAAWCNVNEDCCLWILHNPQHVPFQAMKGKLNLFKIPDL